MSPDAGPSVDYVHRTGAPPGFKRVHLVVGAVIFVVWFAVMGYVLTHGRDEASSVDVYSELPPGFTTSLQHVGVTYSGLSPVDSPTVQQVLARVTTDSSISTDSAPIVLRTTFSDRRHYTNQPALMVVVPDPRYTKAVSGGGARSPVFVDFVDPTTYSSLSSVTYDADPPTR